MKSVFEERKSLKLRSDCHNAVMACAIATYATTRAEKYFKRHTHDSPMGSRDTQVARRAGVRYVSLTLAFKISLVVLLLLLSHIHYCSVLH